MNQMVILIFSLFYSLRARGWAQLEIEIASQYEFLHQNFCIDMSHNLQQNFPHYHMKLVHCPLKSNLKIK